MGEPSPEQVGRVQEGRIRCIRQRARWGRVAAGIGRACEEEHEADGCAAGDHQPACTRMSNQQVLEDLLQKPLQVDCRRLMKWEKGRPRGHAAMSAWVQCH